MKRPETEAGSGAEIPFSCPAETWGGAHAPLLLLLQLLAFLLQLFMELGSSLQEVLGLLVLLLKQMPRGGPSALAAPSLCPNHPPPYTAAAASWLRRKSPSLMAEQPLAPNWEHRRCFTSSSFASTSFSVAGRER